MLEVLLEAYPEAMVKLKAGSNVLHLLAATRAERGARRLRGGGLEDAEALLARQRRRKALLISVVCFSLFAMLPRTRNDGTRTRIETQTFALVTNRTQTGNAGGCRKV